jgi:leucyl aminopeptidase (aminopeptidase T)
VPEAELTRAAETTVDRLGLTAGERFLVAYNEKLAEIAESITEAASARTGTVMSLLFAELTRNGEEPPEEVAAALLEADAAALVTAFSLSHTRARLEASRRGARVASMPTIGRDTFVRAVPVDYARMEAVSRKLAAELTEADHCRIISPGGTDVELVLGGRGGRSDDGDLARPGAFGNLPAGEGYVAPVESAGSGTIVFDGSLATWGFLSEPLVIDFDRGRAEAADGGDGAAAWLLDTLDAGGENGRRVAELGIGTNPAAKLIGTILEDEKVEGTIHIAFGTNTGIGGENEASVHIDGLVLHPTVELDGRTIMRDGTLL